jgi:Zn-dependent protease/predicted transcriptional regulator
MKDTFRIGRIAGVEIGVNWSWIIVFVLIVWTLAAGIFPAEEPGLSDAAYLVMAAVAAVLFFTSLLLHEFGHAVRARREGMQIDGITLWLFGGVAKFRGMFPSAGTEFRVAIAGPLVSIALGLLFVLIAAVADLGREVGGVATWLGYINLVLAAFNMLPAQPLDGGRLLHAAIWSRSGDLLRATRQAGKAGETLGYTMIAGGVLLFIVWGAFGGAWLAFLGWFLLNAARAEVRTVLVRQALGGLRVADLMTANPVTVESGLTLGEFMDGVAWRSRFTTYPVVDAGAGALVGLLTFRRVADAPRTEWDRRRVAECMIPLADLATVSPDQPADAALETLMASSTSRVLVLDRDRLVGILSISDVMRAIEVGGIRSIEHRDAVGR